MTARPQPRRLPRAAAAALGVLGAGVLVAPVPMASAAASPLTGDMTVAPARDSRGVLGGAAATNSPTLAGSFAVPSLDVIDAISLAVTPTGPQGASALTVDGCGQATSGQCKNDTRVAYSWATDALTYNGPYQATASAHGSGASLDLGCVAGCTGSAAPVAFKVAVPPPAPTDIKVALDPGTKAGVLSWARNSQPDIVGYVVERKGPSDAGLVPVGDGVKQTAGARPSYTDNLNQGGGSYSYQVLAIRVGADGDSSNPQAWLRSPGSATATGSIPGAPLPPAAIAPSTGPNLDLAALAGLKGPRKAAAKAPAGPPDTGYRTNLPYSGVPATAATVATTEPPPDQSVALGQGSGQPVIEKRTAGGGPGRALWIPIVGGVGLVGLAGLARWFSRRLA